MPPVTVEILPRAEMPGLERDNLASQPPPAVLGFVPLESNSRVSVEFRIRRHSQIMVVS